MTLARSGSPSLSKISWVTVRLTLANSYYVMTDRIEDAVNYDRLRDEIASQLDSRSGRFWLTIDFTSDPAWT